MVDSETLNLINRNKLIEYARINIIIDPDSLEYEADLIGPIGVLKTVLKQTLKNLENPATIKKLLKKSGANLDNDELELLDN